MKWHCSILMLFPGLVLFGQPKQDHPETIVFTHVTVIDTTGGPANPDATVVVGDGRILDVTDSRLPVPKDGRIINGTGKYLIPGLWDMHGHGFENAFPLLIANGVTGFRFMGSARGPNVERIASLRKRIAAGTMLGPRIVAVCPVIGGYKSNKQGDSIVVTTAEEARQGVDAIQPQGDFLKVMDSVPRDAFFAVADEARKRKLSLVGHMPVYVNAGEASDAGMKSIEHLSGFLVACSSKEPELRKRQIAAVQAVQPGQPLPPIIYRPSSSEIHALLNDYDSERAASLIARFQKNGTWQCPTLITLRLFCFPDEASRDPRFKYIPASLRNRWAADSRVQQPPKEDLPVRRKLFQKYLEIAEAMRRAGVRFLAGSDFGFPNEVPGFYLHDELALLVQAGFTPLEALQTATINPAIFLGLENTLGTVAKGKAADLVLLEADPLKDIRNTTKIAAVVRNGRLFSKAEIDKMLAEIEADAAKQ